MVQMSDAAIIIPHYDDVDRLLCCLAALRPQLTDRCELIVVDNNSTVDLSEIRAAIPNLRLISEPKSGAAHARNRGVQETTAELLFFIDADCVPAPDWIENAFAASALGDVIGGAVNVFDETPPPRSGAEAFETVFAFDNQSYVEEKSFSVTANLLTWRDVFTETGQFDASRSEDVDWCQRAVAKGYSLVFASELAVSHPSRSDWAALHKKWKRMTHESFGLIGSGYGARMKWAAKAILMPVSIVAHGHQIIFHPELRDAREKWAGLRTLTRLRLHRMKWMLVQAVTGRSAGR